ncbi:hypothetical protein OG883_09725 [Streptomyces sp. NBC_01142]|uniref:hypothetical protein n=1 Tax=Streptomyces sp. NBC_01142 TaxID=2975865 RepID=UPI00225C2252|nr:hypothetical protein [Streptomyces sp. NBC_01142]MCX4820180.1 hypothetical protein [Streptomyces sp. NBC_01142]
MSTFIGKFAVLAVVAFGISAPVTSLERPDRTTVVADSGWGGSQPKTGTSSGS